MNTFAQALLISGGIFAAVVAMSYGRRAFTRRLVLRSLAIVAIVSTIYLQNMPTQTSGEVRLYAAGTGLGILFGVAASLLTKVSVERGTTYVTTGIGFVAVWLSAVALRLGFVWEVERPGAFRDHVGQFMMTHGIQAEALAPFFVIWALTMVVARLAVVAARARSLGAVPAKALAA